MQGNRRRFLCHRMQVLRLCDVREMLPCRTCLQHFPSCFFMLMILHHMLFCLFDSLERSVPLKFLKIMKIMNQTQDWLEKSPHPEDWLASLQDDSPENTHKVDGLNLAHYLTSIVTPYIHPCFLLMMFIPKAMLKNFYFNYFFFERIE